MVAPNGARRTPADHPALPITPDAIARTATSCLCAGASAMHLHVRDSAEQHSLDPEIYRDTIQKIQSACPQIVIQTTTEAAGCFDLHSQIEAVIALRPALVSFGLNELFVEGEAMARDFLSWAAAQGVAVQFILYDAAQIRDFAHLHRLQRLHLRAAPRLLLVVGRYSATLDSDIAEFDTLYSTLSAHNLNHEAVWMTCAFGRGELACLDRCIALGGHARVGFENAIVDASGHPAVDNAERVRHVAPKFDSKLRFRAGCDCASLDISMG